MTAAQTAPVATIRRTLPRTPARDRKARRHYLLTAMDVAGYSAATLAARLSLDRTYISRVINGHRTPSLEVALAMAAVLDVPLAELAPILVPAA